MPESEFAERDHTVPPFKVKVVKNEEVALRWKKIINGLISEVKLSITSLVFVKFRLGFYKYNQAS